MQPTAATDTHKNQEETTRLRTALVRLIALVADAVADELIREAKTTSGVSPKATGPSPVGP